MKCQVGCPIRRFLDQSLFPAPQNLSQGITSFIASCCQGIHQTPFSRLIRSRERKAGLLCPGPIAGSSHLCVHLPSDQKSYILSAPASPQQGPEAAVSVLDLEQSHPRGRRPLGPPSQARPSRGTSQAALMFSLHDVMVSSSSDGAAPNTGAGRSDEVREALLRALQLRGCLLADDGGSRRTRTSDLTLIRRAL